MASMFYDVIPHESGWAIVITPERTDTFATKIDAFNAAVELARKLRFSGLSVQVRVHHKQAKLAKAS
jgi:hypothetical protein